MEIHSLTERQRSYFSSGKTLPVKTRLDALKALKAYIQKEEDSLKSALQEDLNKSGFESYLCEIGLILDELNYTIRSLTKWAKPRRVPTPLAQFPARSFLLHEPYGLTLILAPWNYPLLLCLDPLIGAVAAGNCAIIKPSEDAPAVSRALAKMIAAVFPPEWVTVAEGGRETSSALLDERFDFIFFTGGTSVGRIVMEKASAHLTPVLLELGGKSPVIVDKTADLPLTARRIAFGKLLNAGQTCVAPDYVLVDASVKEPLTALLQKEFAAMLGPDPLHNPDFVRIVNRHHFDRLCGLLEGETILYGGRSRADERSGWVEPTLVEGSAHCKLMQEEIFGPILPILPVQDLEEAIHFVNSREKPLALYLFTRDRSAENAVLSRCSFGGGCVNDTIIHLASHHMGFGGVGSSGMGSYHGERSFLAFSHEKSMVKKALWLDLPMRYFPFTTQKEKLVRFFLK